MNENINLCEILRECPKGTKLYSPLYGEVTFIEIKHNSKCDFPIEVLDEGKTSKTFMFDGKYESFNKECLLFPSKDQRDWSKWECPKPKKFKFDPKTLQPFDKVITKISDYPWKCDIFSYYKKRDNKSIFCYCMSEDYTYDKCIPYNEETKHLVGTTDEAPEYYRYWED